MEDNETVWMQITSGQGPDECCWVVARLAEAVLTEAAQSGYRANVIDAAPGDRDGTFKSVLIAVEGQGLSPFIRRWQGSVQWVGRSMYRPEHKRKNWFVGVAFYRLADMPAIRSEDLKFEAMRASGPGGQHTNKTESAVRVTHIPTGITALAQEERSQHLNRKLALGRLYEKLDQEKKDAEDKQQKQRWSDHASLERGNPIRVYEGQNFKLKSCRC